MSFSVYLFSHLAVGNVAGITDAIYQGTHATGSLADVLDTWHRGNTSWRAQYGAQWSGAYWAGFRQCLLGLGISGWIELMSGRSYAGYRCLDLYVRHMSRGATAPRMDAWYLLNSNIPAHLRHWAPAPDMWWQYKNWESIGQKEAMPEYDFAANVVALSKQGARL
jgi:hypothetical protein